MLSVIVGLAAVVTGLVLAAAPSVDEPVIAVAPFPRGESLSATTQGIVADALAQQRGCSCWCEDPGQAAAATDALDGYVPPPPSGRSTTPSQEARRGQKKRKPGVPYPELRGHRSPTATAPPGTPQLPPALRRHLLTAITGHRRFRRPQSHGAPTSSPCSSPSESRSGLTRPGRAVHGRGLLALLLACLLLAFAYLISRTVSALRTSPDSGRAAAGTSGQPSGRPPSRPVSSVPGNPISPAGARC